MILTAIEAVFFKESYFGVIYNHCLYELVLLWSNFFICSVIYLQAGYKKRSKAN